MADGADVNTINQKGETPLHNAVFYDHMGIVDFLLNQNAYVNPKDRYYHTPLHHASAECLLNIVNHLIDLRGYVNAADYSFIYILMV